MLAVVLTDALVSFGAGALVTAFLLQSRWKAHERARTAESELLKQRLQQESDRQIQQARTQMDQRIQEARSEVEEKLKTRLREEAEVERRLADREELLNRQLSRLEQQQDDLGRRESAHAGEQEQLQRERSALQQLDQERRDQLTRIAQLSPADARTQLLKEVEREAQRDAADLSRHIVEEAKARAEEQARKIIATAIQRYAGDHTFETTTATVTLEGTDIKGRIIGKEGRNIRAFEAATGVTVLIDDTPNAVVLSSFDPVRRQIAREAMQRLILDGRIHPTRIEEVVAKVSEEMEETILKTGDEAVFKAGLNPLHPEVVKILGRLRYRHSFSQNTLDHSIEVAHLMGLMAVELRIDPETARRTGLLHDIGKAVDHEVQGSHAIVGAEILKRYGESPEVVNGVASHHDEVPHQGILGILVSAADAISASRPGARSETMTTYLKRLENLEQIGASFPGVERCFAVQAGRELRVIVQPDQVGDTQANGLARSIARRIEEELHYPGQIRVTVVRETRVVEFAK